MRRYVYCLALVVLLLAIAIPAQAFADSTLVVGPGGYPTIQAAVDAASSGDTIKVKAGIYQERVLIQDLDDLNVMGDGAVIKVPSSTTVTGPIVRIFDCERIQFRGFTIDGNNGVGVLAGSGTGYADTRFMGLFMVNSSGKVANNTIKDVSWHNGTQQGIGMYAYVTDDTWRNLIVSKNRIVNFQKGGLVVRGTLHSQVHDNVVTHWGETGIIAGNGIQVDGGTCSIKGNTVSGSLYYDDAHQSWASAGVLLMGWLYPADNYRVTNNRVFNNDVGIWLIDYGAGLTDAKVIHNTFSDNIWDFDDLSTDGAKVHANVYK